MNKIGKLEIRCFENRLWIENIGFKYKYIFILYVCLKSVFFINEVYNS